MSLVEKGGTLCDRILFLGDTVSSAIWYFLFPILTGTHANNLFDIFRLTGIKFEEIQLPLLKTDHAKGVILELANRGQVS